MKTLFYFLTFSCALLSSNLIAQDKTSIVNGVLNKIENYKNHHCVYQSWFKFQSGTDTLYKLIDSRISSVNDTPSLGISVFFTKDDTTRNALSLSECVHHYSDNDRYYTYSIKNYNINVLKDKILDSYYKPLGYTRKELDTYHLLPDTNTTHFILQHIDTSYDKIDTFLFNTLLYVRKSDFMPTMRIRWVNFGGGFQYSKFVLNQIEPLAPFNFTRFSTQVDSLTRELKTHINGDSLDEEYRKKFNKLTLGDTCKEIIGRISQTNDSVNLFHLGDSILIIDFSYTTCGWCIYCIPALNHLYKRYENTGVGVYSVDPMVSDWPKIDKFIGYYKINYPVVKIENWYSFEYGVRAYPTLLIIKNGVLVYFHRGYSENMEEEVIKEVNKALGKS